MTSRSPMTTPRDSLAARLPAFPWDSLTAARTRAEQHEGGLVDLSVGTPVDPTPRSVQRALADASNRPGYPTTVGTPELQDALLAFVQRHRAAPESLGADGVLPTIGSKELVAHLPFQLGIGAGDAVAFPHIAYPTYDMGARFVGAPGLPIDIERLAESGDAALTGTVGTDGTPGEDLIDRVRLLWLNSPSNPTGAVLDVEQMRRLLAWARSRGILVASDECYALLPWETDDVPSILDPRVNGGDLTGLLCVYSLSKQSNLAGYRAAFVAGDPTLVGELLAIRKQAGMMLPAPIQAAMTVALADDDAAEAQRAVYRARREQLKPAVEAAGGRVDASSAGLYLWTTFAEPAHSSVERMADLGILCAPGIFYGGAGENHVRIALTATDERIAEAVRRLSAASST